MKIIEGDLYIINNKNLCMNCFTVETQQRNEQGAEQQNKTIKKLE
jgi:hypothetical protein